MVVGYAQGEIIMLKSDRGIQLLHFNRNPHLHVELSDSFKPTTGQVRTLSTNNNCLSCHWWDRNSSSFAVASVYRA